jgi:hypothetical protein
VLPDVVEHATTAVPTEMLASDSPIPWGEVPKQFFRDTLARWTGLHEMWDPTLRLLVRLQNRYWPRVLGTARVATAADGSWEEPEFEHDSDPVAVLAHLAISEADLVESYRFLARRGHALDVGDNAYLLRQMLPRAHRRDFEGQARKAQDFYDAAEVIRRFHHDLTGTMLPDAEVMARAHTETELRIFTERRELQLGHAPSLTYDAEDAKRMLHALGVYPHGSTSSWREELLGYFDEPTTNGYAEGVINKVKVIKRRAYGLRTFTGFRRRVVIACG